MRLFEGTEFYQPPRCSQCDALEEECQCPAPVAAQTPPNKQAAVLRVEKRKKGKVVTVVRGLAEGNPGGHFSNLLTRLKNACGAGGTIQVDAIEIQGDHLERLSRILKDLGYKVRG
ncbi:MAG: translation initiation factor 1 [Mariniblastus sp.]|jgi:translation initiation factor 1